MWLTLLLAFVFAPLVAVSPAQSVQLSRPQVEYSADSTMQTEDGVILQKVYATPTMERREMLMDDGETPVLIFRYDTKVMWQLMPSEKMYMEQQVGKSQANDPSQWDFEETVMGDEVLDGIKVKKYKTIATSSDGKKYGGFSWRTKDGIAVKQDLLFKEGNEKSRLYTELHNLKIGKQDPRLFEVPKDFTKLDMAGMMGGGMGMMGGPGMGRQGMGQPTGKPGMRGPGMNRPHMGGAGTERPDLMTPEDTPDSESEPDPPADDQSDMQKARDFMKGLFGQ